MTEPTKMDVLERLAGERGGLTSYNLCACTICDAYREIVRLRGQVEALRALRDHSNICQECGDRDDSHCCEAAPLVVAAVACGAIEP